MKIFGFIFLLFSTILPLNAQEGTNIQVDIKEQIEFIQVSNVTKNSAELFTELSKIEESLNQNNEVQEMQKSIEPYCNSIAMLLETSTYKSIDKATVRELQKMRGEISIHLKQLEEYNLYINNNVKLYDTNNKILKEYLKVWGKTYDNAFREHAPKEFTQHIISVLDAIALQQQNIKQRYDRALTNSQLVTTNILILKELKKALKEKEIIVTNRVFYQNSTPLLETNYTENLSIKNYFSSIKKSFLEKYRESKNYIITNNEYWLKFFILSFLTAIFVIYYNFLYRKKRLFVSNISIGRKIFFFIARPFSTYSILFILSLVYTFTNRVSAMTELILLFLLLPVVRIIQTVINKEHYKYLYTFVFIYTLNILNINATGFELENRVVILINTLFLLIFTLIIIRHHLLEKLATPFFAKIGKVILYFFVLLLTLALFANFYGSVLFSSRVLKGTLSVLYVSIIFYTFYVILTGYIIVILRRRISSTSNMLDKYSQKIETVTSLLIKIWMFTWWIIIATKLLSIYPYLVAFYNSFMSLSWNIAQTTISISSIFDFLIIVLGTWALARLAKTVFEVEIFSRFSFPRGAPTAILTTMNYTIIISGTIIAFSSLGVTPQQFALVFGALGVGIGFGLRNIIANFVSGIIMVFERPIQIGDTIEVDKTMGKVQSIGARSSTVKTFDGSEVIIPNADFIAKEIINWTLSDEQRRKTVEFKVALHNDIDTILEIMKEVAISHKNVLKDPQPLAVFKGFGEYYLEFKLYFWLSDNLIVAQSDVTLGIYRALQKAGIEMPIPKTNIESKIV
jgi:small-conductance mechanosensitive channel